MDQSSFPPVFDGHNDTILSLLFPAEGKERTFFERSEHGHLDLPRAREGGLGGGFFAMFTPSPRRAQNADAPPSEKPLLPEAPAQSDALNSTNRMLATLRTLVSRSDGEMQIVHNADELQKCMETGIFAVLLHIESAEAIDTDLHALHVLHAAGLRSIGPIWSRANAFATGVPFSFPATPDIGPGLTDAGKALVRECNTLGIMVDLSHMNEKGFWEVAQLSEAPLVATHSNAHTLAQSPRNLTDRQLDAVRESGGVVGVNFHIGFLREDGRSNLETSLHEIVRHTDYLVERMGLEHVALGSDFDGAVMPQDLKDVAGLPKLMAALRDAGYDYDALEKIAWKNWVRVLGETLK